MGVDDTSTTLNLERYWQNALTFDEFLPTAQKNVDLWRELYGRALIPGEAVERAGHLGQWRLLVLSEDWCGDAVNTVPVLARLVADVPNLQLRILARDRNPELMDAHLTGTSRSIPVVMALDEDFREHGWWGPRPAELQKWFLSVGREMPKDDRYREIRKWYARDRGESTIEEVLSLLENAESAEGGHGGTAS